MVKLEWGTKRTCQGCTARFYDLRHTPVKCPMCGDIQEILTPGRRSRRTVAAQDLVSIPLDDELASVLDLPDDLTENLESEEDFIEDTSELGEGLDDMVPDVMDVDGNEE